MSRGSGRVRATALRVLDHADNRNLPPGFPWPLPMGPPPRTRGDCKDGPRPCGWVTCRHHAGVEQLPGGGVRLAYPDRVYGAGKDSCALDVADRGGATLDEIGKVVNRTRERSRQVETMALEKLKRAARDLFGWELNLPLPP
jgi:hypothetical protein